MSALGPFLCLPLALTAAPAMAETVRVLDHLIMGEQRFGGEKIGEFSSLVRAPDGNGLLAVSDRGYIARLKVTIDDARLTSVAVTELHPLTGPEGAAMPKGFSPEAAAVLPDGNLAVVDEATATLHVFDATGAWLFDDLLPPPLRDVALQASAKDGVEALAFTAATGAIAVSEEPYLGEPRNRHLLHSTFAGSWVIKVDGPESTSIKGLEVEGDTLFVLERTRDDVTDALYPFLRILDLAECQAAMACTGTAHPLNIGILTDADFEGIAALGGGRFLIVSDDKIDGVLRSVFALLAVE
jgi:Esterase-like activity of phytase